MSFGTAVGLGTFVGLGVEVALGSAGVGVFWAGGVVGYPGGRDDDELVRGRELFELLLAFGSPGSKEIEEDWAGAEADWPDWEESDELCAKPVDVCTLI